MLSPKVAAKNLTNWAEALAAEANWYPHEYFNKHNYTGWGLQSVFWHQISGEKQDAPWPNIPFLAEWDQFCFVDNLDHFILFLLFVAEFIRAEGLTEETFK